MEQQKNSNIRNQNKQILEQNNFKCGKCGFYSPLGKNLVVLDKEVLCEVCNTFAPDPKEKPEEFRNYLNEKLEWQFLETFRKYQINKSSHNPHKKAMLAGAKQGKLMARPPFGYDVVEGKLIPNPDSENVRLIFQEFSSGKSLNQISKQYGLSVNGVKKILKNFTYLGKIKFAGNIVPGNHPSIISPELFNQVQEILDSSKKADF